MIIGIPKEIRPGETRVALIPESVKTLVSLGHQVLVENNAGNAAGFSNEEYLAGGALVEPSAKEIYRQSGLILKVNKPAIQKSEGGDEVAMMNPDTTLIGFLQPFQSPDLVQRLTKQKITAFSLELVPRISRAQSMDALTSMATVGGYKAVLLAANSLGRFFPMFMSAAGTIPPARVLVLGAGVAGLQAIATAKRLGGTVEAFDTRPVVKEQVESLGARFVGLPEVSHTEAQDTGGYAKELSHVQHQQELELIGQRLQRADVVITTAQIPGKKSPLLITADMVKTMRAGSVIVDLAVEGGGNCEWSDADQTVVKHGVTILAPSNIQALLPTHASQMFSRNITTLLRHLTTKDGLKLELEEEITKGCLVTRQGVVVHPALKQ